MKKIITIIFCLFAVALSAVSQTQEEVFDVNVQWNGSLSSIVSPWGSKFSKGVSVTIKNITQKSVFIQAINVYGINDYGNETYIGTLNEKNITISSDETITLSFSLTSNKMPENLPIIKIDFNTLETAISNISNSKQRATMLYDLNGRIVTSPKKGAVFIKGGKKIIWN